MKRGSQRAVKGPPSGGSPVRHARDRGGRDRSAAGPADESLSLALEAFLRELRHLEGRSEQTVRAYRGDLLGFFRFIGERVGGMVSLAHLDAAHARLWIAWQHAGGAKPRSVVRRRSALRRFTRFLLREALLAVSDNPHRLLGIGGSEDVMAAGRLAVRQAVLERIDELGCCGKA